jgi:hypothetical protein
MTNRLFTRTRTFASIGAILSLAACNNAAPEKGAAATTPASTPAQATAPATALTLAALSEADLEPATRGCSCAFDTQAGTLLSLRTVYDPSGESTEPGTGAMIRVNGEAVSCMVPPADAANVNSGSGSFACGDYQVTLAPNGPASQDADDAGSPVTLTVARGGQSATANGLIDCAC